MRIGFLISGVQHSRPLMRLLRLASGLRGAGHQVEVICRPEQKDDPLLRESGLTRFADRSFARPGLKTASRLAARLKQGRYDILHCFSLTDLSLALKAAFLRRGGERIFLSGVSPENLRRLPWSVRVMLGRVSGVILSSRAEREALRFHPPLPMEKLAVLPGGLELAHYNPDRYDRHALRREWRIPGNAVVIGMLSRLRQDKGHMDMLRAVRKVTRAARVPVVFLIAGVTEPEQEAFRRALLTYAFEELGLNEEIIFAGFYPDANRFLASLDIFLYPVHRPFTAFTLLQAMALCLPVVAARSKLTQELVQEDVSGMLVPAKNPDLLADALTKLVNTPSLRRRMGIAGRMRIEEHFQLQHSISALEAIYQKRR